MYRWPWARRRLKGSNVPSVLVTEAVRRPRRPPLLFVAVRAYTPKAFPGSGPSPGSRAKSGRPPLPSAVSGLRSSAPGAAPGRRWTVAERGGGGGRRRGEGVGGPAHGPRPAPPPCRGACPVAGACLSGGCAPKGSQQKTRLITKTSFALAARFPGFLPDFSGSATTFTFITPPSPTPHFPGAFIDQGEGKWLEHKLLGLRWFLPLVLLKNRR